MAAEARSPPLIGTPGLGKMMLAGAIATNKAFTEWAGILDNLKLAVEIMAHGGGFGVNLSTLRPRGSHIRSVNGTSSGLVAWAELYSVATGEVIQQDGSRRGAAMLMLDDSRPDVEEFVTAETDQGRLLHSNLSVCISHAFMTAVDGGADWQLRWLGEVTSVVKARTLWERICTAAWQSAEPGHARFT